jgi:hypothetical protein
MASELRRGKLEGKDRSAEAFIFPNADSGFIDTANHRPDTTAYEYRQEWPESVQEMAGSI